MFRLSRGYLFSLFLLITLLSAIPSAASAAILGRWKLDEGTGSTAIDSSGNGKNGTWSGTASGNTGYYDTNATSSLSYSGSFSSGDDQVLVTGVTTVAKSVTFWAYIPSLSGTTEMVSKSTSGQGFEVIINGGTIQFYTMGSDVTPATASSGDINLNAWNHIVATYNGGGTTMRLYINGVLSGSTATAPATVANVENLYFGTWGSGGRQFAGKLNDVRLYDVELNLSQVQNVMGGSVDPDTAPDSTAPAISSIATSSQSSSGGTITWTTDEAASTKVVYSLNTTYGSTTSESDTSPRVTSHSKTLSGLLACTTYNFKVVSRDAAGNSATSSDQTLTTTGCSGGATPTSATTTSVTVSSSGSSNLTDNGRTLSVQTPANFTNTSSSVVIQIKGLSSDTVLGSLGKPSSSLNSAASIVFNVTALIDNITELDSFNTPVTVSYTYTDSDINGLTESTLSMYHYADGSWSQLDNCSVNTGTNTITCQAPHFSVFAIFGTTQSSSSSSPTSTGGGTHFGCKDPKAKNYEYFSSHKKELCQYAVLNTVRDLKLGSVGDDVKSLQKFLNANGYKLATSGSGSPGQETTKFGVLTLKALRQFQLKNKITPSVGYFGQATREKIKQLGLDKIQ